MTRIGLALASTAAVALVALTGCGADYTTTVTSMVKSQVGDQITSSLNDGSTVNVQSVRCTQTSASLQEYSCVVDYDIDGLFTHSLTNVTASCSSPTDCTWQDPTVT